tara:strand:- start:1955 stop:2758 length:804 start_codon:yes stop_codon:yes gene_type:complete
MDIRKKDAEIKNELKDLDKSITNYLHTSKIKRKQKFEKKWFRLIKKYFLPNLNKTFTLEQRNLKIIIKNTQQNIIDISLETKREIKNEKSFFTNILSTNCTHGKESLVYKSFSLLGKISELLLKNQNIFLKELNIIYNQIEEEYINKVQPKYKKQVKVWMEKYEKYIEWHYSLFLKELQENNLLEFDEPEDFSHRGFSIDKKCINSISFSNVNLKKDYGEVKLHTIDNKVYHLKYDDFKLSMLNVFITEGKILRFKKFKDLDKFWYK